MKILLIDNYDSFTQNIVQYLYEVSGVSAVVVNNTVAYKDLMLEQYDAVVLSPGPGHPGVEADFGVCREVVEKCDIPLLGICLGHQGIAQFLGGSVGRAPEPVHGYRSTINHNGAGLFLDLPEKFDVVRYHSLVCTSLSPELICTAWTDDGVIMGIEHGSRPIWGVQFHPESIDSECGHALLSNFIRMALEHRRGAQNICVGVEYVGSAIEGYLAVGGIKNICLHARVLSKYVDPELFYAQFFGSSRYAFWLDCEGANRPDTRFSIMGSNDSGGSITVRYCLTEREMSISGPQGTALVHGDVFSLLDEIFSSVNMVKDEKIPFDFKGGFVGYFGYELKALCGGGESYLADFPDALFIFARGFYIFDHEEKVIYECLVCEDGDSPRWVEHESLAFAMDQVKGSGFVPGVVDYKKIKLDDSPAEYLDKISRSLDFINNGQSYEICLTNRASMKYEGSDFEGYRRMRKASPVPYGAYLRCGEFTVLSASPETFLRISNSKSIESRPIKGTRPRSEEFNEDERLREDLLTSTKDRAENLMIVDLVRHDLNKVCRPGSVHVPELFKVESFTSVHQLVSTVRGQLSSDVSSINAIKACFPGGSMTGAPKKRTMEIIDALEGRSRGIYSGALGWMSFSGAVNLSIVIRTAVLRDGVAEFGIGGAIVAHSDPVEELNETLVKASVPYYCFGEEC
jgi:para-aminobenzoate synthetase